MHKMSETYEFFMKYFISRVNAVYTAQPQDKLGSQIFIGF